MQTVIAASKKGIELLESSFVGILLVREPPCSFAAQLALALR